LSQKTTKIKKHHKQLRDSLTCVARTPERKRTDEVMKPVLNGIALYHSH